ncbi:MAG: hypothetical protein ACKOSO_03500, partial [Actinomycetota bacterium]
MRRIDLPYNADAGGRIELLLVASVTTVLVIRAFLAAPGYPQVGGGGLHIAHLLWGGLGLLIAVLILLSVLGRRAATIAALAAGIGFGLFIDEVGKFVTSDNDYFYKPAIGLIYVAFVILTVTLRIIRGRPLSRDDAIANALWLMADAQHRGLDEETRERIHWLLQRADADDPDVVAVRTAIAATPTRDANANVFERGQRRLAALYEHVALTRAFATIVIAGSIVLILIEAVVIGLTLAASANGLVDLTTTEIAGTAANAAIILVTAYGIAALARGLRARGLAGLRTALLISLLIAQPIAFWEEEL